MWTRSVQLFRIASFLLLLCTAFSAQADALIISEIELEGYFEANPDKRNQHKVSKNIFSSTKTHCALSRKSVWKLDQIDQAIRRMQDSGEIARILLRYRLTAR